MGKNKPDLHDVDRINEYHERDWVDVFLALWKSKLGLIIGVIFITFSLLLIFGVIRLPTIVWGETELVVISTIFASLGLGAWFIVIPMLRLSSTPIEILFVVNAARDTILDFWIMHPVKMSKVDVTEGKAYHQTVYGIPCYFVRNYDSDSREAEGVWMGESNDIELATAREEIKKNRGRLRHWARIGHQLYASLPAITQAVESSYNKRKSDYSLDKTTTYPDVVKSEVIEDVELLVESIETPEEKENSDDPDAEEMMEEAVDEEVGDIPDEWQGGE